MSISGMGFTGQISVDLQSNLQVNCMHVDSIGCFSSFVEHIRLVIMEIRSLGHLMSRLLILPESLLIFATIVAYLYTMFWQYIEEGILCLNH
jgi:hypothetical protein